MSYAPYRVMPCQVSGQSVAKSSWTLAQASGVGAAAEVGPSAARATPTIALMVTKGRANFFTVLLLRNAKATVIFKRIYRVAQASMK